MLPDNYFNFPVIVKAEHSSTDNMRLIMYGTWKQAQTLLPKGKSLQKLKDQVYVAKNNIKVTSFHWNPMTEGYIRFFDLCKEARINFAIVWSVGHLAPGVCCH